MINICNVKKARVPINTGTALCDVASTMTSAALLRLTTDLTELDSSPPTCQVTYPDPNNLLQFILTITPDDGFYKGGRFTFSFTIESEYPHSPPKVKCTQRIYHPNINPEGNVCLNILRDDWNPVLTIMSVILGMNFLFTDPNPHDPLNKEAAEVLISNVNTFKANVANTMAGGRLNGIQFDDVLI